MSSLFYRMFPFPMNASRFSRLQYPSAFRKMASKESRVTSHDLSALHPARKVQCDNGLRLDSVAFFVGIGLSPEHAAAGEHILSLKDYVKFFSTFVANPSRIGAVTPSSNGLCREMVEWIDWEHTDVVVEYGPGTGVFTDYIVSFIHPDTKFVAIELTPDFADMLRQRFPQAHIYQGSVAEVKKFCDQENISEVDAIVCGLPWSLFSEADQNKYLDAMFTVLKPGGQFTTFAYLPGLILPSGVQFKRKLYENFSDIRRSRMVWRNIPPAFVYRCRR